MLKFIYVAAEDIPIWRCPDQYTKQTPIGIFKKGQELEVFRRHLGKVTSICTGIYYQGWILTKNLIFDREEDEKP